GSYRNSDRQLDLDVMPGQVQACAGHKRLLRDPSAREAGAFGTMEPGERAALSPYTLAIFALARHLCPPASHSALRRPAVALVRGYFQGRGSGFFDESYSRACRASEVAGSRASR